MATPAIRHQYETTDPLQTRILTHAQYSEHLDDGLHAMCRAVLNLAGNESLLDVGCGPGDFSHFLRTEGHTGRLAGLDQSTGMIDAARAAAVEGGTRVEWLVGEADALPFADGEFDVITARHMLYHVPHIPSALREFARVVGPRGRVLATTNGGNNLPHIAALERDLHDHFGMPQRPPASVAFAMQNAPALLESVFPIVDETARSNALVFTAPEPIVAYIMTITPVHAIVGTPRHEEIRDWLTTEATRRLAAMGGTWRDPKDVGIYVCKAT